MQGASDVRGCVAAVAASRMIMAVAAARVMVAVMVILAPETAGSEGCGCWGSDQVYVQQKAPITGWYKRSPRLSHTYMRELTLPDKKVHFILKYKNGYWLLVMRNPTRWIASNRRGKNINVICPGQCSCQTMSVEVNTSSSSSLRCSAITGNYKRRAAEETLPVPQEADTMSPLTRSACLLSSLARCVNPNETRNSLETDESQSACLRYAKVLSSEVDRPFPTHYVKEVNRENVRVIYNLTSLEDGDFWWIEKGEEVYAVSSEGGPCPHQLPAGTQWHLVGQRNGQHFGDIITVHCSKYDTATEN